MTLLDCTQYLKINFTLKKCRPSNDFMSPVFLMEKGSLFTINISKQQKREMGSDHQNYCQNQTQLRDDLYSIMGDQIGIFEQELIDLCDYGLKYARSLYKLKLHLFGSERM